MSGEPTERRHDEVPKLSRSRSTEKISSLEVPERLVQDTTLGGPHARVCRGDPHLHHGPDIRRGDHLPPCARKHVKTNNKWSHTSSEHNPQSCRLQHWCRHPRNFVIPHFRIPNDRFTCRVTSKFTDKIDSPIGIPTNVAQVEEVVAVTEPEVEEHERQHRQPRDGQIQLIMQQSRVPTMTMITRFVSSAHSKL